MSCFSKVLDFCMPDKPFLQIESDPIEGGYVASLANFKGAEGLRGDTLDAFFEAAGKKLRTEPALKGKKTVTVKCPGNEHRVLVLAA